jgi:inosine/xanthosine triphosphate pyrophosphatase family protein
MTDEEHAKLAEEEAIKKTTKAQKEQLNTLAEQASNTQDVRVLADDSALFFAVQHAPYLTAREIAETAGVSRSTLDHAATQPLTLATAKKLADAMHNTVGNIFYVVEPAVKR